jgi:hypothetical protein
MSAPALSLPELRERVRHLHVLLPAPAGDLPPEAELVTRVATLLREVDDLLARFPRAAGSATEDDTALQAVLLQLRNAAFLIMRLVNPDQAWFWTPEWQAGEREVDANQAAGLGTFYGSTEEFIAALDAARADLDSDANVRA